MIDWKISIKDFGKISSADIDLSKFTVFLGDNNSGKSYLMSLIYGLLNIDIMKHLPNTDFKDNHDYCVVKDKLLKFLNDDVKFEISELYQNLINILNYTIDNQKEHIIREIFNKDISISKIYLSSIYKSELDEIKVSKIEMKTVEEQIMGDINISLEIKSKFTQQRILISGEYNNSNEFIINEDYVKFCIAILLDSIFCTKSNGKKPVYLPVSRTGFMLLKDRVGSNTLRRALSINVLKSKILDNVYSRDTNEDAYLTQPCLDFLDNLIFFDSQDEISLYKDIIDYLENFILNGQVVVKEIGGNKIFFKPNSLRQEIPMYISSGVVTEIAPLVVILKYFKNLGILMMEEPEMCLHPKLQLEISRCLIRLYNTNTPIIITTHSDIILQHINNMYKLSKHHDKEELMEKYGYKESDLINIDDIKLYQFDVDYGKTKITPLNPDEDYGFIAPTFNQTLESLYLQSREFYNKNNNIKLEYCDGDEDYE